MKKLFRYSGNKSRLLQLYRKPTSEIKRVVEPYLGSGIYTLHSDLPGFGYETNGDIVAMWHWLSSCTEDELVELKRLFDEAKIKESKPDVRSLNLARGPQTYVRINATSVYTGQLTSWKIYPQHQLPIDETISLLPRLKDIEVVHGSANQYLHRDGDLLFIDPPYIGTFGGYVEKSVKSHEENYDPKSTMELIRSTSNPVIFTYGTNALQIFPELKWEIVKNVKVPNLRRGGTVDRVEWVSYINW